MNIEKEVDKFIENIKSIEEYTNEVKNNSELIRKIANESVEISKIKEELNNSINMLNGTNVENTKILENNFNKIDQRENNIQQQLNTILQKSEEQNKTINDNINNLKSQILDLTKICKIGLGILGVSTILLALLLFIK